MENFSLDAKNISIEDYNIYEWNIDLNLNSYMARFDEIQLKEIETLYKIKYWKKVI